MSKTLAILLLAVAVIGVGAFFFLSSGPALDDGDFTQGAGTQDDLDALDGNEDPASASASKNAGRAPRPSLLGRASMRIGVGGVVGRLVDFATKDPAKGITVQLTGTGFGGEAIEAATKSGDDGRFHLKDVPAGRDLVLEVLEGEENLRTVVGVGVGAGKVEDLGTVWLGEGGTLEGKVLSLAGKGMGDAEVRVLQGAFSQDTMMRDFFGFLSSLDRDPVAVASGTTDAAGRFRVEGVPPGPITVIASVPGHHLAIKNTAMTKDGALGGSLVLQVGEATPITGRVLDEDGKGFPAARVALLDAQNDELGFLGRRFVETGEDGTFRIDSPPSARKLVAILTADGYPTSFTEVKDEREGLELTLRGGAKLALTILHDESGEPMADAMLVVMASREQQFGDEGAFLTGITDAAGQVDFAAMPGFVMMVMIQHPDCGTSMYSPQAGMMGMGRMVKGPEQLALQEGDNEAELRVPRGLVLHGTVKDVEGKPVVGASVSTMGGFFGGSAGSEVLTDETGAYRLTTTPMGGSMVLVEAAGYVQDPEMRSVGSTADATEIQHDVVMLRAVRVEGKIVAPGGAPAVGVEVKLQAAADGDDNELVVMGMDDDAAPGFTDGQGRYVLEDVAPDQTCVVVSRGDGYVVTKSETFKVGKGGAVVEAPRLELQKGVQLEVLVFDLRGDPLKGAEVAVGVEPTLKLYWSSQDQWRPFATLVTDARGRADVKDVPDGQVTVTATHASGAPGRATANVEASASPPAPIEVHLRQAVTLRGTVVDQHGNAVTGAAVTVRQTSGGWLHERTDAHGIFEVKNLPTEGSVQVSFHADGYISLSRKVEDVSVPLELVVRKIDSDVQERLEALQAETMELYQKMGTIEDEAEQQALMEKAMKLQEEMQELRGNAAMEVESVPASAPAER